jgi:serine/threonine-protein kinase
MMSAARMLPFAAVAALLLACGQAPSETTGPDASAPDDSLELDIKQPPPSRSLKDLGPTGRRVKVIILPGDASVEIDGFTARRRDGVIELVGHVGEVRRLRVFRGTQQMKADVKIEQAGASPALLDLNAAGHGLADDTKDSGSKKSPASLLPEELE